MEEEFDLIEYQGFKNIFVGLYKGKEYYYMIYGKTGTARMNTEEETEDVYFKYAPVGNFLKSRTIAIEIPFVANDKTCCTVINLQNKAEYHTIVKILKDLI